MSNNCKIAIAEDHAAVMKALTRLLENEGFEVVIEAVNGNDLIEQLSASPMIPDVFILDLNMPVMDGRQAIPELKSRWPSVKIVVFSMDNNHVNELLLMGASAFLLKSSPTQMLIDTINRLHN